MKTRLLLLALIVTACGGGTSDTSTAPSTTTPPATAAPTSPATAAPSTLEPTATAEPLSSFRFSISVGLTALPGSGPVQRISELAGEATVEPKATRIFGELRGRAIDLIGDSATWRDAGDPDLELSASDIERFLGGNGLLLPDSIAVLLQDRATWETAGAEVVGGLPTRLEQRHDVVKGVDWEFGDLARLDVWRDELDQIVRFKAWFATGDNAGFPVATWEITERNPAIQIAVPAS